MQAGSPKTFDFAVYSQDTEMKMQTRVNKNLTHLKRGETGILDRLDLPEAESRRLMELGFLPGHSITPSHSAPFGGDPRVFRVDGSEIALRRETAQYLILKA
jgi:Fe2+ transport system protein FeoA